MHNALSNQVSALLPITPHHFPITSLSCPHHVDDRTPGLRACSLIPANCMSLSLTKSTGGIGILAFSAFLRRFFRSRRSRRHSVATTANAIAVQPSKAASAIMALPLAFSFDRTSASSDSATAHVGAAEETPGVLVAGEDDTDAVMNMVVVPLHIGSPPPILIVPLPDSQHARDPSSCPQQKLPYSPHGVKTASLCENPSIRCQDASWNNTRYLSHCSPMHMFGHSVLFHPGSVQPRLRIEPNPDEKQRPFVRHTSASRQQ